MPLRLEERPRARAFWRSHFEVWELSGLTQREYCERHGLSLKNFGNWRAQLKREDAAGPEARWGRHPRLRPMTSPMTRPRTKRPRIERPWTDGPVTAKPAPDLVTEPNGRRRFSEDAKKRIVEETCRPGASVSGVARRYGIAAALLFRWRQALGAGPLPEGTTFLPVQIADVTSIGCPPLRCGGRRLMRLPRVSAKGTCVLGIVELAEPRRRMLRLQSQDAAFK